MSELLRHIKDNPDLLRETALDRHQVRRIDESSFAEYISCKCPLPLSCGGTFDLEIADPLRTLKFLCRQAECFGQLLDNISKTFPADHVYKVILYYDEVTPGNLLRLDNRRKFWSFYWSLLEFNHWLVLSDAWIPLAVLRSWKAADVKGKLSGVVAQIVQAIAPSLMSGCTIDLPSAGPTLLRAVIHNNLGDEAALKRCLDIKGSAGMVPCIRCKNVVYNRAGAILPADGYVVPLSCCIARRFDPRTDDDVFEAADKLKDLSARGTQTELHEEEKCLGINHNPNGLLLHPMRMHFKPISTLTFDSMHVYFSNGIVGDELFRIMDKLSEIKVSWGTVKAWLGSDGMCFPTGVKKHMRSLHSCFNLAHQSASKAKKDFKCQASEALGLVPLMNHFLQSVILSSTVGRIMAKEIQVFALLADVVHLLQRAKRSLNPCALVPRLEEKVRQHFAAWVDTYGVSDVTWKRHSTLHLPEQILRDGRLLDSFALERKHQLPKSCATHLSNKIGKSFCGILHLIFFPE